MLITSDDEEKRWYRFEDFRRWGLFKDRMALMRAQQRLGFPRSIRLSRRMALFDAEHVDTWITEHMGGSKAA